MRYVNKLIAAATFAISALFLTVPTQAAPVVPNPATTVDTAGTKLLNTKYGYGFHGGFRHRGYGYKRHFNHRRFGFHRGFGFRSHRFGTRRGFRSGRFGTRRGFRRGIRGSRGRR